MQFGAAPDEELQSFPGHGAPLEKMSSKYVLNRDVLYFASGLYQTYQLAAHPFCPTYAPRFEKRRILPLPSSASIPSHDLELRPQQASVRLNDDGSEKAAGAAWKQHINSNGENEPGWDSLSGFLN